MNGLSLGLWGRAGAREFGPESLALAARFEVAPTTPRLGAIDRLIVGLQAAGVWGKLDAFYVLAAHSAQAARQNWIGPNYNLTPVGVPVFTPDQGYRGNGVDAYLDTGFNPRIANGNFQRDHASLGFWNLTDSAHDSLDMGFYTPTLTQGRADIRIKRGSGQMVAYLNDQTYVDRVMAPSALGLASVSRLDGTTRVLRQNNSHVFADPAPTTGLIDGPIQILAATNSSGGRSSRLCAAAWIGAGLTQDEHVALWRGLKTYLEM